MAMMSIADHWFCYSAPFWHCNKLLLQCRSARVPKIHQDLLPSLTTTVSRAVLAAGGACSFRKLEPPKKSSAARKENIFKGEAGRDQLKAMQSGARALFPPNSCSSFSSSCSITEKQSIQTPNTLKCKNMQMFPSFEMSITQKMSAQERCHVKFFKIDPEMLLVQNCEEKYIKVTFWPFDPKPQFIQLIQLPTTQERFHHSWVGSHYSHHILPLPRKPQLAIQNGCKLWHSASEFSDFCPEQDGIDLTQLPPPRNDHSFTRGLSWQCPCLVKPSRQEPSSEFAQQCRQTIGKD